MHPVLTYLTPPVLGAFIGYITNYIAIKMLFRPLHPWHIFGLRVPMTPGVIPAKRAEFAENVGTMVGDHLLTGADVAKAIGGRSFQNDLRQVIEHRLHTLLHKELGPLPTLIPTRFHAYFEASIKVLRWRALKHLQGYLDSESFSQELQGTINRYLDELLSQSLDRNLTPAARAEFFRFSEANLAKFLASPLVRAWIESYLETKTTEFLASQRPLNDLLPRPLTTFALARLEEEIPTLLQKLADTLGEPEMQEKIAVGIKNAITSFIATLGPMAALVGNFLPQATIESKIREYLAAKGGDIAHWLLAEGVQTRFRELLRSKVEGFLATPVATLLEKIEPATLVTARQEVNHQLVTTLVSGATLHSLTTMLQAGLAAQTSRPLQEVVGELFGTAGLDRGRQWLGQELVAILRSHQVKKILENLLIELAEKNLLSSPLGTLTDLLPKNVQLSIGEYLLQQVSELLQREVPDLVDSLNIQQVVARKVNSLDLHRLEWLLMGIMEEQFKYINLFGGLLGFIIGLFNLFFL